MQSLAGLLHTWQWHVSLVPAEITKMLTARSAFVNGMSAALSVVGFGRASPEELGFDPEVLEMHKQRIKTHQENGVFTGFAEGALSDGKIVFLNLCGFTDKTKKHRMTERTLFRGYSMMKPITATAFMSLVDDGMLKLDDPVHKFIPKFKFLRVKRGKKTEPLRKTMTLRHLLMHTSGIGYGPGAITPGVPLVARSPEEKLYKAVAVKQETGEVDSLEKLCEELCSLPLLFQPGADYTYGMSLDVLGYVAQKWSFLLGFFLPAFDLLMGKQ
ncbi:unnamed protein product [Cladocopium goreaui]|uniref:Beta-lactamase-related domain-containing protein n=1 Tax=Cladocopium goreaui TaxID=2562237 RepID=A0A9P1GNP5_9DINO|nr:unnamed protein product [Cladocopium goreaui]